MNRTLICIPTYDERENVQRICEQLLALIPTADLLFVDDNSPDGTGDILDGLATRDARLKVIHRPAKQGIGSAHQVGIAWAYEHGYDRLATMDCDFTHSPEDLAKLLDSAGEYAVTLGSRFVMRESLEGWGRFRVLLTHAGHWVTRNLLRLPFDASGALRIYNLRQIPRELFGSVRPTGYAFFFESLLFLVQNGASVQELPIRLPARTAGHSKMSWKEVVRGVSRLFLVCLLRGVNPGRFRVASGGSGERKGLAKASVPGPAHEMRPGK